MSSLASEPLISPEELEAVGRQEPEVAKAFLQALLRVRAGAGGPQPNLLEQSRWSPLGTLAEAYMDRPPTPYLVERMLPLPSLNIFYGPPGTMKSMALMDLAMCVAIGRPWLALGGGVSFGCQKATVLWLDLDQGEGILLERLAAIGRAQGADPEKAQFYWKSLPQEGLDLEDVGQVEELLGLVRCIEAKLVCIDNLGVAKGRADENRDQMIPVMYRLRQLAERSGSAVVVLHHSRKESGYKSRFGEAVRGHNSITGALDLALEFEREEQEALVRLKTGKGRRRPLAPFTIQLQVEHFAESDDLRRAWFEGVADEEEKTVGGINRPRMQAIDEHLLAKLERGPQNQTNLIGLVMEAQPGASERMINRRLQSLVNQGRVQAQRGSRNALVYSLANPTSRLTEDPTA